MSKDTHTAELEADNRRLRHLLEQRNAPGELRHRLRTTLAMLRVIIRTSALTKTDIEAYVAHLEDRLDALMRAQAAADEQGSIDLHKLLGDEFLHYRLSEDGRVELSGPSVDLRPRAGQVIAMAIHELTVNAVEHGGIGDGGTIRVAWTVSEQVPDARLALVWKETGARAISDHSDSGFGTDVLTRMLPYELNAETSLAFESDGLRCVISFPLSERIGQVGTEREAKTSR